MTRKQSELLDYIRAYLFESGGVAPSFEEMKDALELNSKSGVHRLISALEQRGLIRRLPNRARAIEIIPQTPPETLTAYSTAQLLAELSRRSSENARAA